MQFELIENSWFKRRLPTEQIKVVEYEVLDFAKIDNHPCVIIATMADGSVHELGARVNVNKIHTLGHKEPELGRWTVCGINPKGMSVMLEVLD